METIKKIVAYLLMILLAICPLGVLAIMGEIKARKLHRRLAKWGSLPDWQDQLTDSELIKLRRILSKGERKLEAKNPDGPPGKSPQPIDDT